MNAGNLEAFQEDEVWSLPASVSFATAVNWGIFDPDYWDIPYELDLCEWGEEEPEKQ